MVPALSTESLTKGSDQTLRVLDRVVADRDQFFRAGMKNGLEGLQLGTQRKVWSL